MARDQKVKVRIEAQDSASGTVEKVEGRFSKLGSSIKANALKITAALASVALAFREIERGAEQVGQRRALERNLASQGIAIEEFIGELKRLSDNQIATNELILASNRALKLGIQAQDLPGLLTVSANAAVELGVSTSEAFDRITTGIGRSSTQILDDLGIVLDATNVYKGYAVSINKSVEELTKQEKTTATVKSVISEATGAIDDFSKKQDELTRSINRGRAAFQNLRSSTFQVAGGLAEMVAGGLTATVVGLSLLAEAGIKAARGLVAIYSVVPGLGNALSGMAKSLKDADDGIDRFQQKAARLALDLSKGGAGLVTFGLGLTKAGEGAENLAEKLGLAGGSADRATGFFTTATEAAIGLGNALGEVTSIELEQEISKINEALAESAEKLGINSREYIRLEEIAATKIESLKSRIESIRDGLGDLKTSTEAASDSLNNYGGSTGKAAEKTDDLNTALESANSSLKTIEQQAIRTAAQFDALAASAGRAAAIAAALQGGATLVQGGTRVRFAQGGSRLTSEPVGGGSYFRGEKRSYVEPNGNVVFI